MQRVVATLEGDLERARTWTSSSGQAQVTVADRIESRVNLREGPATDHRIVDVLLQQTPVFPEREENGWVLVRVIAGPAGWVHKSLLHQ